jgi:hypothetical protein
VLTACKETNYIFGDCKNYFHFCLNNLCPRISTVLKRLSCEMKLKWFKSCMVGHIYVYTLKSGQSARGSVKFVSSFYIRFVFTISNLELVRLRIFLRVCWQLCRQRLSNILWELLGGGLGTFVANGRRLWQSSANDVFIISFVRGLLTVIVSFVTGHFNTLSELISECVA